MNLKSLFAVLAVSTAALAGSAQAVPIIGSIGIADGLEQASLGQTVNIVSQLTAINDTIGVNDSVTGCTGVFATEDSCNPPSQQVAIDFTVGVAGTVYVVDGFTFTVEAFGPVTRLGLTCQGALCGDSMTFQAIGTVTGNGYDASVFLMNWSATGVCTRSNLSVVSCTNAPVGTWNVTITALGARQVPEPATLALFGLALAMLGFAVRRRKS